MNKFDKKENSSLALVLSGGGARGAYEVGVIHYIRTMLPQSVRHRRFPIQCGSSVGAINTCFMASSAHDLDYQGKQIVSLWRELKTENIYLRDLSALSRLLAKSTVGILKNLFRPDFFKERHGKRHFASLFDTKPFLPHLTKIIDWRRLHQNVREGLVDSISLVATRMRTGMPEIFLQKGGKSSSKGDYVVHNVNLGPEYAMASAAIPLVFPSIAIGNYHYVDGSVRLNTPLSPAIHLGAQKILAISLHSREKNKPMEHACPETKCPPSLGEHLGKLFNAFFIDRLNYDIDQLERINCLIEASEKIYGTDYLLQLNKVLGSEHPLNKIDLLEIGPTQSLSSIFAEWYQRSSSKNLTLTSLEKLLMRILDIEPALSLDLMSYLTFEKGYLDRVIEIGFEDARAHHDQLIRFLEESS